MNATRNLPRTLVVAGLLVVAAYTLTAGLAASLRDATTAAFFPVAVFALIVSTALGKTTRVNLKSLETFESAQPRDWSAKPCPEPVEGSLHFAQSAMAWFFILLLGFGFIVVHNGQLNDPLFSSIRASFKYEVQRALWIFDAPPPDASEVESAYAEFASRAANTSQRVRRWAEGFVRGGAPNDPLAREIAWSLPVLLVSAWLGWSLARRGRALGAILPSTALLAFVTEYSGADVFTLQIHLIVLLLLLALHEGRVELRGDAVQAVAVLSVALVLVAGFVPSISAREILNAEKERARRGRNDAAAEALGLQRAAEETDRYRSPGLPNERLIGGAPDNPHVLAFTVSTNELPPMPRLPREERPPRYYWRSITYDTYTGRGWAITIRESRDEQASALLLDTIPRGYRMLSLEVDKSTASSRLFWTGSLLRANQPMRAAWRTLPNSLPRADDPLRGADLIAATSEASDYRAQVILPVATLEQLRAAPNEIPAWVSETYLTLPSSVPDRVRALARELTATQTNTYDKARALESFLRRFPYTLDVPLPPTDRDIADYFLFDLQKGYCDYYATTMVVLARAAGLPARLVTGYASGEYVPAQARYVIRESDAHSWVEIYFKGIGWIEFEPTANRPLIPRVEETFSEKSDVSLGEVDASGFVIPERNVFQILRKIPPQIFIETLLLCACIGLTAGILRERRRRNAPVKTITEIYKAIYRMGRKLANSPSPAATPFAFSSSLETNLGELARQSLFENFIAPARNELSTLTEMYVRAIYSPREPTREETILAMRIWRRMFWRLAVARITMKPPS